MYTKTTCRQNQRKGTEKQCRFSTIEIRDKKGISAEKENKPKLSSNSSKLDIAKISLTSPVVINVPTRASLAVETKVLLFQGLAHLNNKNSVCKQISFLFTEVEQRQF